MSSGLLCCSRLAKRTALSTGHRILRCGGGKGSGNAVGEDTERMLHSMLAAAFRWGCCWPLKKSFDWVPGAASVYVFVYSNLYTSV